MYNTTTIKNPLPVLPEPLQEPFPDIIKHLLYSQAPSMIINRINKTKTIAAEEPQLPIIHSSFFFYSQYFMEKREKGVVLCNHIKIKLKKYGI